MEASTSSQAKAIEASTSSQDKTLEASSSCQAKAMEASASSRYDVLEALVKLSPRGCAVLDGGLATELERRGADLKDPLLSAKCLLDEREASIVRQIHFDYYKHGADVCISASYQATVQGFMAHGLTAERAEELLERSVTLVAEARDQFWEQYQRSAAPVDRPNAAPVEGPTTVGAEIADYEPIKVQKRQDAGNLLGLGGGPVLQSVDGMLVRQKPLVAASIGSYGAYLTDGSEFSGDYGADMTVEKLVEFHRRRLQVLARAGPDILAFETIPSLLEAQATVQAASRGLTLLQAIVRLLEEESLGIPAWIAFSAMDGAHVASGDLMEDCAALADACEHVVAVGVNCTAPRFIRDLIVAARRVTKKLVVVYPNSGETWDPERREWQDSAGATNNDFMSYIPEWVAAGASLVGGCCRTTPDTISCITKGLAGSARGASLC